MWSSTSSVPVMSRNESCSPANDAVGLSSDVALERTAQRICAPSVWMASRTDAATSFGSSLASMSSRSAALTSGNTAPSLGSRYASRESAASYSSSWAVTRRKASVVTQNPRGTRTPSIRISSPRLAPFPPASARCVRSSLRRSITWGKRCPDSCMFFSRERWIAAAGLASPRGRTVALTRGLATSPGGDYIVIVGRVVCSFPVGAPPMMSVEASSDSAPPNGRQYRSILLLIEIAASQQARRAAHAPLARLFAPPSVLTATSQDARDPVSKKAPRTFRSPTDDGRGRT